MEKPVKKIGNHEFVEVKVKSFEDWVTEKLGVSEFNRLSIRDKREMFLFWKWGFTNKDSNDALESSEQEMLRRMAVGEETPPEDRDWITRRLKWGDYCRSVWNKIESGLLFTTQQSENIRKEFGGRYA